MAEHRREGLVLSLAVGIVGMTFGVLADAAGLSLPQIIVMSAFLFTGASQFAAVSVIDSGGSSYAAVGSAMLLAARNALYGPVVSRFFGESRLRRGLSAHFVIDETTAMASVQEDADTARDAFWFTGLWLFVFWNVGTVLGVLAGGAFDDPGALGLDAAFPAAFVAMLAPHLRTRPGWVTAIGGGAIALVAVPTTAAGVPMLLGALAILPGLWVGRRSGGSVPRDQSAGSAP